MRRVAMIALAAGVVGLVLPAAKATARAGSGVAAEDTASPAPESAAATETAPVTDGVHEAWATRWYGWQMVPIDALAVGSFFVGLSQGAVAPTGFGAMTYLLAAPIIHLGHGRAAAVVDLGLRAALPVVGGALGMYLGRRREHCRGDNCENDELGGLVLGIGSGGALALAVDYIWLARERVPVARGLAPTLSRSSRGAPILSLVGSF